MNQISSSYYLALSSGYAIALFGWWLINRCYPPIWRSFTDARFDHPWWETLWAFLAALATVAIGILYSRHLLLPELGTTKSPLVSALNQVIIFSPFIALLLVRKQPLESAWLPSKNVPIRLGAGIVLALAALLTFYLVRQPPLGLGVVLSGVYQPKNFAYAIQVFLEDFALAIFFVRLRAALGAKRFLVSAVTVAFLFSAAHYPAKLSGGESFITATRDVVLDGLLVSAVIYFLQRSRDFLWFWCVHFTMDMLQFYAGNPNK